MLYNLSRLPTLFKWMDFVLKGKAIRFRNPYAITVEENKENNTYVVNLYYPFLKITLIFDEKGDVIDYEETYITDLLNVLNDIYGELYNLAK